MRQYTFGHAPPSVSVLRGNLGRRRASDPGVAGDRTNQTDAVDVAAGQDLVNGFAG